jgi:hypothetical protein
MSAPDESSRSSTTLLASTTPFTEVDPNSNRTKKAKKKTKNAGQLNGDGTLGLEGQQEQQRRVRRRDEDGKSGAIPASPSLASNGTGSKLKDGSSSSLIICRNKYV